MSLEPVQQYLSGIDKNIISVDIQNCKSDHHYRKLPVKEKRDNKTHFNK